MIRSKRARLGLALVTTLVLIGGVVAASRAISQLGRTHFTAYFSNSNGIYRGDAVQMLGVRVGQVESIEPQATRAKVKFWVDDAYPVPADVKAVIISPQLVTWRAIALTPVYSGGPRLAEGAMIPQTRTAVPVEFDDLRQQLQKLAASLQPNAQGVSPLGAFVDTAADNLRGQGGAIREAVIQLSQTLGTLGDESGDLFGSIKNLAVLVKALHSSGSLLSDLNNNLAEVTRLLSDDPDEVGRAVTAINSAVDDVQSFVSENRDAIGTASEKLTSISSAVVDSLDDVKQTLHSTPNAFANFINIYKPSQSALVGVLPVNNFADTIQFICGAIQAASRMNAQQSAKLCVQYLAPIIKNRQYNFLPIGVNPFVNEVARPNEITYSEDRLRPDFRPPPQAPSPDPGPAALPAESPSAPAGPAPAHSTNPAAGITGMMVPGGGGS